jgi:hypothetical protein
MPPHCDTLDGPVVSAARQALEAGNVELVLPYVNAEGEAEIRAMFDKVVPMRELGPEASEVGDRLFFETVVRVHREGEGEPYTGLKPAGLSVGPAIPLAERAVESGSADEVATFLTSELRQELTDRLARVQRLAATKEDSLEQNREFVEAMLGFEVYSHGVFQALHASGHGHGHAHAH